MPDIAWLNGKFMPLGAARVPVMDRSFLFGDGIYEVIRTAGGRPLRLADHLRRLASSARKIDLACPGAAALRRVIAAGLRRAGYPETFIYLQVSRGADATRTHVPAPGLKPTVLVAFWRWPGRPEAEFTRGIACATVEDFRWGRCDIKTVNLLANCLGKTEAHRRGAQEVIFVRRGCLVEGGSSAVFVVRRGRMMVPALGTHILPSLTREQVLRVARQLRLPVSQRPVTVKAMMAADEVFLASTTAEALPVVKIDGRRIGSGRPGPVAAAIRGAILRARGGLP
jgi:D-alanine transaminase